MSLLLVALGAAVGAVSRWLTDRFVQSRHTSFFPWGTFTVNVLGSLVLGFLLGLDTAPDLLLVLGTGFCGGFTTFSTFSFETVVLAGEGRSAVARIYVVASLAAGLAAAYLGWWLGTL
ncbi:MAG: fluoride efflux transporter CrcB [Actinobacteria bacterium]|nr:fluoride efflux transporter CrcB [Actinomycetota bacterium]MCB8998106.1 fluoride efflux transporter CrcB [Actinomycetota bacterium]MCB9424984.1 fluoride efflux transporter CrcB [Actinomycetota bacterium]